MKKYILIINLASLFQANALPPNYRPSEGPDLERQERERDRLKQHLKTRRELEDAVKIEQADKFSITGFIKGKNNSSYLQAEIYVHTSEDGKLFSRIKTDPTKVRFQIDLPKKKAYTVIFTASGYISKSIDVSLRESIAYTSITRNMILDALESGAYIFEHLVHFEGGTTKISGRDSIVLEELKKFMQLNPDLRIEIEGHTAKTFSKETKNGSNVNSAEAERLKISEDRATIAAHYLIQSGISAQRILPKGYGSQKPIADNATEEGRSLNRRIEFRILPARPYH